MIETSIKLTNTYETKYLIFNRRRIKNKKTYNVDILNKDNLLLGEIYWRTGWRTYVINIQPNMEFDIKCWEDVSAYVKLLLQERLDGMKKNG